MAETIQKLALIEDDLWLTPYENDIRARMERFYSSKADIESKSGSLVAFADGYKYLGINYDSNKKGWWYREWAPNAHALFFMGDFNNWDRSTHPLTKVDNGVWEIFLADSDYANTFKHEGLVKVHIHGNNGHKDRIPAYIRRTIQNEQNKVFSGQHWAPEKPFHWNDKSFSIEKASKMPLIYEAHIGMAQEKEGVGTYREFADQILPRIKNLGYNTIQFMAIAEHPYYGSFGYHVSNYFAPSSRFGTPEDLKYLVNEAHKIDVAVIMDIVHSHAVKNIDEGLNEFDGTDHQYFHTGGKGYHDHWDSKLFDYGKWEVKQFLLSNLKYWMEEFHFDGFRFDGITSMLYEHHGYTTFDHYDKYFKDQVDWDSVNYVTLANELIHTINKNAISVAEDMSGMPGGCRKPKDGGLGFDFRLGMGIPDYWIKILKHQRDEDWDIFELYNVLTNRRYKEKTICYAESHDQALVGDKTLAFWLMDKEMYWHMSEGDQNMEIDRGISLHKIIRLITLALGGEGYMTFIGNEFGHPEWIDFPREGNEWSHKYARRQWSLADNEKLKYKFLNNFDKEMIHLAQKHELLHSKGAQQLNMDSGNKVIIFERKNLIFIFNFSPFNSIFDYRFPVPQRGTYKIILNSDARSFGGHGRIDTNMDYFTTLNGDQNLLSLYLTNRTALVLEKIK
ncbi:MAG: alpha amylase C-terminal domain-containing protein [Cytophagales bacterium]